MSAVPADPVERRGSLELVPMRRRDLRAVLRIEAQHASRGWSLGLFLAELGRPEGRRYLVARRDGRVVGYAGMLAVGDEAHLVIMAVDEAHRRAGIGLRLLVELVRWAVAGGATSLHLEVRAGNEAAIALYRRAGLAPVGVRRGYYREPTEDALLLRADGIDTPAYAARLDDLVAGALDGDGRHASARDLTAHDTEARR